MLSLRNKLQLIAPALLASGLISAYAVGTMAISRVPIVTAKPDYNLRLGDYVTFDLKGRVEFFSDDNADSATDKSNKDEAIGNRTGIVLDAVWPVNADFTIRTDFGMYYTTILSGEATEGLGVTAGKKGADIIAFDLKVGDHGILTFADSMTTDLNTIDGGKTVNTRGMKLWRNDLYTQYSVKLNPDLEGIARAGRIDTRDLTSDYKIRNRYVGYVALSTPYTLTSTQSLAPYVDYRALRNEESNPVDSTGTAIKGINDADAIEAGLVFKQQFGSKDTVLSLTGGYKAMDFDDNGVAPYVGDDFYGLVGSAQLANRLSPELSHYLRLSYDATPATSTQINYNKEIGATYGLTWDVIRDLRLGLTTGYLHTMEVGAEAAETKYNLFSNTLRADYQLNTQTTVFAEYRRTDKVDTDDATNANYRRNVVIVGLDYNF